MNIFFAFLIFFFGMIMSSNALDESYEIDDNGCVAYSEGNTDDNCIGASDKGLFDGNSYSHSYKCTQGSGYACCASTNHFQSNVQDLGQCTRNYQEDHQGCIPFADGDSDDSCIASDWFTDHNYSYTCTEGEKHACCNTDIENLSNVQDLGQCVRKDNLIPPSPSPTSQSQSYKVDDNGCVPYNEGSTDNNCKNASGLGLFNGNIQSNSYQCTGGSSGDSYACCASTNEYQSNVQDLGQCTRNYQEDDQGCIPARGFNNDDSCAHNNGFTGHNFSYTCSEGETYACCNSNTENLSNVQDLGQCQRNTSSRRNLRRRI